MNDLEYEKILEKHKEDVKKYKDESIPIIKKAKLYMKIIKIIPLILVLEVIFIVLYNIFNYYIFFLNAITIIIISEVLLEIILISKLIKISKKLLVYKELISNELGEEFVKEFNKRHGFKN